MRQKLRSFFCSISFWTFLMTFVIAVFAGFCLSASLGEQRIKSARERASIITEIQASRLARTVDNLFSITETLNILLKTGEGRIFNFEEIAPDLIAHDPIRNITLAPGGVVTKVYPLKGNETALGHDLLGDPARALEARMAKYTRKPTLSGPYELRQGGFGIICRLPVYLENDKGEEYFWGFTCVTVDIPDGLSGADMQKLEEQGYAYELWRISPDTGDKQIIMKSDAPICGVPEEEYIEVPNSTWVLSVSPAKGWSQKDLIALEFFLTLLFAVLVAFLARSGAELAKSRHSLQSTLAQQEANYRLMDSMNESLRAFRHDIGNHLMSLGYLLNKGDLDSAVQYMHSISEALSDTVRIINTENYVFDAIVAQKLYEAGGKGIYTERDISIPGHLSVDNEDWSALFGNALDNAIEACERVLEDNPQAVPKLRISVRCRGSMLQACITNTALRPNEGDSGGYNTGKTDKKNHGLGLKRIKAVVSKYGGVIETSWKDEIFTLSFMLLSVKKGSK